LVDELHMEVPFWRDFVSKLGMVRGSREICAELMQQGAHILVFPGGRREILKKKGEAYKLRWENRYGFVKMAVTHGYDIIPVASVGGEETYEIVQDSREFLKTPLGLALNLTGLAGKYLKGGDHIPPVAKGLGWTGLPKPQKLHIQLGERIETSAFQGQESDPQVLEAIKGAVEGRFESLFEGLKEIQKQDRDEPWRWLLKRL
jgi:1-acyl-sn-glycerol-3-phosphate acyltransferase